jgi:hypothetical protein
LVGAAALVCRGSVVRCRSETKEVEIGGARIAGPALNGAWKIFFASRSALSSPTSRSAPSADRLAVISRAREEVEAEPASESAGRSIDASGSGAMTTPTEFAIGDPVELTVAVNAAPAGACGSLTDLLAGGVAVVEVTSPPLAPLLDRRVVAAVADLRPLPSAAADRPGPAGERRAGVEAVRSAGAGSAAASLIWVRDGAAAR